MFTAIVFRRRRENGDAAVFMAPNGAILVNGFSSAAAHAIRRQPVSA